MLAHLLKVWQLRFTSKESLDFSTFDALLHGLAAAPPEACGFGCSGLFAYAFRPCLPYFEDS